MEKADVGAMDLWERWKQAHAGGWDDRGLGTSAADYAYVVCEERTGGRKTLAFGYQLGGEDLGNRKRVRDEVDAVLAAMATE